MKRTLKILALMLAIIMTCSSLVSCDLILEFIEGSLENNQQNPDDDDYTPPHACESKCNKCQGCKDIFCTEDVCDKKCMGHDAPPVHTCDSMCSTCGKCTDPLCNEDACKVKCEGHNQTPAHTCGNICDICRKCTDKFCAEDACESKCEGCSPDKSDAYGYTPIISSTMPAIYINTPDGSNEWATKYNRNDKINGLIDYVEASVSTGNCDEEYLLTDLKAEVKVRGNYTLEYAKKPIRIKLGKNDKSNFFGLHDGEEYRNWVLLADWKDLSMSNNAVAFYLGNTILGSDGYYCTDFQNVEVYLNGQYWGVYLLVEQQEVKDGRTSVPEVEDDYTGNDIGYLLEYDGYYYLEGPDGDPTFTMSYPDGSVYNHGVGYTVKSDIYADSQLDFIKSYMDHAFYIAYQATLGNFYKFNENYTDVVPAPEITDVKTAVEAVIDVQSLVDTYILNEIACDPDVDWSSFYISVDMTAEGNKKITFEAPWDWDSCFGLRSGFANDAQGLYALSKNNTWFRLLAGEDWYWNMVYAKWAELKEYNIPENAINLVKVQKETYKSYYIKNYTKWSSRVYEGNGECVPILNSFNNINTAQGLAADYLVDWLTKRFAYLDGRWKIIEVDENLPENAEVYKYEAESASLAGFDTSNPIRYNRAYASNNAYVGNVHLNSSITFTVTAEEATTAYIFAGISKRATARDFNAMFSVTVNGETLLIPMREVPAISAGEEEWHTFISVKLAPIELSAGVNTITFTTISSNGTNFDYIEIYSAEELS